MVKNMHLKNKEHSNHFATIKQSCFNWGKQTSKLGLRAREVYERASMGSNFHNLGVPNSANKSFTPGLRSNKVKGS